VRSGRKRCFVVRPRLISQFMLAATACYAGALLLLTHWPRVSVPAMPGLGLPLDKIAHVGLYAGLAMLVAVTNHLGGLARRWFIPTLFVGIAAFGAADEATQILSGRTCDFNDWLFDLIGAVGGLVLVSSITRFIGRVANLDLDRQS
jgi:hypothetical protein